MLKSTEEEFNTYEGQNIILDLQGKVITSSSTTKPLCTNNGKLQIIDNSSGKTGKLESTKGTTIQNNETGAITIGDNSTNIDNNTPTIYGKQIGIKTEGEFNFYDGKIQGITPIQGSVTKTPEGFGPVTTDYTDGITTMQLGIVNGYEARIDWVYYTTVKEAVEATKTDVKETVTILKNIQLKDVLQISENQNMILDLDRYELTMVPEKDRVIENYGTLEITDSSIEKTGKISTKRSKSNNYGIYNKENGSIRVTGGTVSSDSSGDSYGIYNNGSGSITVIEGTVSGSKCGIYNARSGSIEIMGGTVKNSGNSSFGNYGVCNNGSGRIEVRGGIVSCSAHYSRGIYNTENGRIEVTGGIVRSIGSITSDGISNCGSITITGGSIISSCSDNYQPDIKDIYGINNFKSGRIEVAGGTVNGSKYGINNNESGNITVIGGTVSGNISGISNENGNITVTGGAVSSIGSSYSNSYGIQNNGSGIIEVIGGTVSSSSSKSRSSYGIYNNGSIRVTGGTVSSTSSNNSYGIYNTGEGNIIVTGGTVSSNSNVSSYGIYNYGSIIIGEKSENIVSKDKLCIKGTGDTDGYGIYNAIRKKVEFYNGMIQGKNSALLGGITKIKDSYRIVNEKIEEIDTIYLSQNKNTEYIAEINERGYYTITEAIENINENEEQTIKIVKDFELSEVIHFNKNIILDLNGKIIINKYYKIENTNQLKIIDSSEEKIGKIENLNRMVGILNEEEGKVTIDGGTVSSSSYGIYNYSTGNIEVTGGTVSCISSGYSSYGIYNYSTGNIEVTGGTVSNSGSSDYNYGIYNNGSGNITVTGGTVSNSGSSDYNYGIYNNGSGNIEVTGGTVSSVSGYKSISKSSYNYGIYNNGSGNITVTGGIVSSSSSSNSKFVYGYGIYNYSGDIEVIGGTVSGSSDSDTYGIYNEKSGDITVAAGIVSGCTNSNYRNSYGIYNAESGSVIIGEKGDGIVSKEEPYIKGKYTGTLTNKIGYGIYNREGKLYFYDGKIEGSTKAIYDIITEIEEETELEYNDESETIVTLSSEQKDVAQIGEKTYKKLQEAIDSVESEKEVIKILRNVRYMNTDTVIINNKNIIIDLNGYQITSAIPEKVIQNEGILEIIDTSERKAGKITTTEETTIYNINGAELIINGGTIENRTKQAIYNEGRIEVRGGTVNNSSGPGDSYGIYNTGEGNIIVIEGTVSNVCSYNSSYNYNYGIYNNGNGNITVTGGTVSSSYSKRADNGNSYGIYNSKSGNIKITGGTISGTTTISTSDTSTFGNSYGIYNNGSGSVEMTGGTVTSGITSLGNSYGIYDVGNGSITVTGGIVSAGQSGIKKDYGRGSIIIGEKGDRQISKDNPYIKGERYGLSYNTQTNLYFYDGKIEGSIKAIEGKIEEIEDNTELLITKSRTEIIQLQEKEANVAEVNGVQYDSIQKAIKACENIENTIQILRDSDPGATIIIEENQNIILDLNGYTMKIYQEITNNGTLKITDNSVEKNGKIVGFSEKVINNIGTLEIQNGNISDSAYGIENKGTLVINGGNIENNTYGIYNSGGNVTIQNETTISNNTYGIYNCPGTITINNGGIISENTYGIYNYSGTTNVNSNITGENYGIYIRSGITNINKGVQISADTGIYNIEGTTNIKEGVQISANIGINNAGGTVTIGEQGTMNPDSPIIMGETYGLVNKATVNMYDGQIKGKTGATQGYITKTETGYTVANRTEGEYKVDYLALEGTVSTVAQVNGVSYSNLQSAINSIVGEEQQTIKLTNGIITTSKLQINEGQNIILDMNGKTISSDLEITLENAGTLTIIDTTGSNVAKLTSTAGIAIRNTGTLTLGEDDGTENQDLIIIEGLENTGTLNKYDGTIN